MIRDKDTPMSSHAIMAFVVQMLNFALSTPHDTSKLPTICLIAIGLLLYRDKWEMQQGPCLPDSFGHDQDTELDRSFLRPEFFSLRIITITSKWVLASFLSRGVGALERVSYETSHVRIFQPYWLK